jgi:plastocyanin domain-containing protein
MMIRSMRSLGLLLAFTLLPLGLARAAEQPRRVEIAVTENGFSPDKVKVKNGEPLELVITRTTDQTCAKKIVVKEAGVSKDLPLNQPVIVSLTPHKTGELKYACGLNMLTGVLLVE